MPVILFFSILCYFPIILFTCYSKIGGQHLLEGELIFSGKSTYGETLVDGNKFITGSKGLLYYPVKDIKQAILVNLADSHEMFRFYDLIYMLLLNIVIFAITFHMKENTIFSDRAIKGSEILLLLIIFAPGFDFLTSMVTRHFMERLTNYRLTTPIQSLSAVRLFLSALLINFLPLFISYGKNLQQEKDLTI